MSEQYPGKNPETSRIMFDMQQYQAIWNDAREQAERHGLRIVEHGWEQHVIIDEAQGLLYRYPRHEAAAAKLKDEVEILQNLQCYQWPTRIPQLLDYHPHFATYRYIPGEVITPESAQIITNQQAELLGSQLGSFLAPFHGLDHNILAHKATKHSTSLLEYYTDRIEKNPNTPHFEAAHQALGELVSNTTVLQPVVLHGDLHGLNIVVDESNSLQGVIDLSEMEIGDPHQEFRKIFMSIPNTLSSALAAYEAAGGQHIDTDQVIRWAYVNEWANLCYFSDQPKNLTYQRAYNHLANWHQL